MSSFSTSPSNESLISMTFYQIGNDINHRSAILHIRITYWSGRCQAVEFMLKISKDKIRSVV